MTPYEQAIVGRKNSERETCETGWNLRQNKARGGTAIGPKWLGMKGGKQDKRYSVAKGQRLKITND